MSLARGLNHARLVIRPLLTRTQRTWSCGPEHIVRVLAFEGTDPRATLARRLLARVPGASKITPDLLEQGFSATIESLDAPAAYALTAKTLYLSNFDEERVARLADNIVASDPLVKPKDKLLKEFKKLSS